MRYSPIIESARHSIPMGILCGGIAGGVQLYYGNSILDTITLTAGGVQLLITTGNSFVNMRIYNSVKMKVNDILDNTKQSKALGSMTAGLESGAITYLTHGMILETKGAIGLSLFFGATTIGIYGFYEKHILK